MTQASRVRVDGKFFSVGTVPFQVRGLTYGPFQSDQPDCLLPDRTRVEADFDVIAELGANVLRCYQVPPEWFFDLAAERQLRLFVDVPWAYQLAFLDEPKLTREASERVREFARTLGQHPALFAACLANEIPPDLVRWSGAKRVGAFLDDLLLEFKSLAETTLATVSLYPSTEYLTVREHDFLCFNVYLEQRKRFTDYLARLHSLAGDKPLVLGEIGHDSLRSGEARQAEVLGWQLEVADQESVAGQFVYAYCDEWFKDGRLVTDWAFGLVDRDRKPKAAFAVVQHAYRQAVSASSLPSVSVIVAAFNAGATIAECLESLGQVDYPQLEVIVVDDGSRDDTAAIVKGFAFAKLIKHPVNQGLSAARNSGIEASGGHIVAFTDADCRVDRAWLRRLVATLERGEFGGVGGPNIIPDESSEIAVAVDLAPGGPTHVLLTDRTAEHIPGCNMAFYRSVLDEIGGFDPLFRVAGDDVDLCWRVQQRGYVIAFCPGGFVWHERRGDLHGYLRQQMGYGRAEALLAQKFPALFNSLGDHRWRGRIYAGVSLPPWLAAPVVYRGIYGRESYQLLPNSEGGMWWAVPCSLELQLLMVGGGSLLGLVNPWFGGLVLAWLLGVCTLCLLVSLRQQAPVANRHAPFRIFLGLLYLLQPLARGWGRFSGYWSASDPILKKAHQSGAASAWGRWRTKHESSFWSASAEDRARLIGEWEASLAQAGWSVVCDDGYRDYDLSIMGGLLGSFECLGAEEYFPENQRRIRVRIRVRLHSLLKFLGVGCSAGALAAWLCGLSGSSVIAFIGIVSLAGSIWWRIRVDRLVSQLAESLRQAAQIIGLTEVGKADPVDRV